MLPVPWETTSGEPQRTQRPHRKSRLGCKVCKARKIKCDESRPVCGQCIKRFPNPEEECEFEVLSPPLARTPSSAVSPASMNDSITSLQSQNASRAMELRLFHHYSTSTCHAMPLAEEEVGREMWAIEVPNIAFDHPYVYSAVLAVAALHLLTDNPNDVLLQTATYQYIDESLSGYRNELSNINSDNALAVFTASILLGLNARLRYRCLGNNPPPYSLPLEFLHLQRGTKEIFYRTNQVIAGSGAKKWVDIRTDLRGEPIPRPIETSAPYVNSHGFEFPSDRFLFCWDSSISLSIPSERKAVYDAALKYLAGLKDGM